MTVWSFEARGDTSAIRDFQTDAIILEVEWDGKQNFEGGVNDVLCRAVDAVNARAALVDACKLALDRFDPNDSELEEHIGIIRAALALAGEQS